jgi:membrane-bound ClpP family serine protease
MIKKILLDLIVGTILVYLIMFAFYDGNLSDINYANALFVVGLILFSAGLLTVTNASKVFRGFTFVFKRMFTRKVEGMSYYEYVQMKDDAKEKNSGFPLLISGLVFIIASLIVF